MDHVHPAAGGIFRVLDTDWAALCADDGVTAAVADWLQTDNLAEDVAAATDAWVRTLGPAHLLAALAPHAQLNGDELADAILRALLRRAAGAGRPAALAARIVVQAMIPAAIRLCVGQLRDGGGRTWSEVGHTVVAALFEVARSGRIHHRPGRPAGNVMLDALKITARELEAERVEGSGEALHHIAQTLPDAAPGPYQLAHARTVRDAAHRVGLRSGHGLEEEPGSARLELLELVLDALEAGALSPGEAREIARYYAGDDQHEPGPRPGAAAGRKRRSRAVTRLRRSATTAAAAA